jgi:MoaA/NifB/PqqE/SkfB family radical SAM enzyme
MEQTEVIQAPGGVASNKVVEHEDAAHEKRNWVRLTYDCNNRCTFCLDSDTHDGEIRNREEVKNQILDGRRKGAERLILSGGEPTIHPNYVDFIKLGRKAGYRWIQTVTNGRLFSYPDFLKKCLDAGLDEITFSLHGPNAKIHDALVGVKGAFDQEIKGLELAMADGRPVVNIDIVINRGNVKQLPRMMEMFTGMGVKEFDLLQVIPFGRAFTEGREDLFYNLEEMRSYLLEAFAYSKKPDLHVWLNRFPPQHLEGYESLIQDPYKLNDEVRGRKEEYARLLEDGIKLDCREPHRCQYCYLERLCDTLDEVRDTVASANFEVVRVDTEWEAQQGPVYGGDPASSRRARHEAAAREEGGRVSLNVVGGAMLKKVPSLDELIAMAGAKRIWICAPDVAKALAQARRFAALGEVQLDLASYEGLEAALANDGTFGGARLVSVRARDVAQAEMLLAIAGSFEVQVALTKASAAWLLAPERTAHRLAIYQPTYERLTESAEHDVDLRGFFDTFKLDVPVEGVPACSLGRPPRKRARTLDTAMMTPEARLEIFRYTKRYILEHYLTKSLRCKGCVHNEACDGMHVNYVRAHGYGFMQPVAADAE